MNRFVCIIVISAGVFLVAPFPSLAQAALAREGGKPAPPQPARLLGLAFAKPSVAAGDHVKIMLRLTKPAPPGGFPVVLECGARNSLRVPQIVTIPAGASAMGLTVAVSKLAKAETLSVKAAELSEASTRKPQFVTYRTAKLNVTPAPKGGKK